jgi:hypothetical protein
MMEGVDKLFNVADDDMLHFVCESAGHDYRIVVTCVCFVRVS